jgi:hypothetical protein
MCLARTDPGGSQATDSAWGARSSRCKAARSDWLAANSALPGRSGSNPLDVQYVALSSGATTSAKPVTPPNVAAAVTNGE